MHAERIRAANFFFDRRVNLSSPGRTKTVWDAIRRWPTGKDALTAILDAEKEMLK